jgi:hypothetical protein
MMMLEVGDHQVEQDESKGINVRCDIAELSRLEALAKESWHRLARFVRNPFSRPTTEEVQEFNTLHGYDRIYYEKGN